MVEGDVYDEDDLDLYCLAKKDTLDALPSMKRLSQLKIKSGDSLVAYVIDDLKELQEKQGTTTITILREDDDDFELTLADEQTAKDAVEQALRRIKGDKFKADHCKLYSLVPEGDERRCADDYTMKDCKRFNTLRFYCGCGARA